MRPELKQLERIDLFLNGTMEKADKIIFEQELTVNSELQAALETQSLLITAVNRKALLAQIQTFAPASQGNVGGSSILSKFKWHIILSSIVIGSILTWFALKTDTDSSEDKTLENAYTTTSSSESQLKMTTETFNEDQAINSEISTEKEARKTKVLVSKDKNIGGLITWISPEVQQVEINPNKDEIIECKNGSLILIPKNAFVDTEGNPIKENVTVEIVEALTYDKMLGYNLSTMSNGKALQSDGMIYIQPKLNGKTLQLADGKTMQIEIPTDKYNPEMIAWRGVPDGKGNLNWENPQKIENYLIPVELSSLDFIPKGFREEVQATLPFKNHSKSSRAMEDSLYFAVGSSNTNATKWELAVVNQNGNTTPIEINPSEQIDSKKTKTLFKFENLPNETFVILLEQGDFTSEAIIENNRATLKHFVGLAKITVSSGRCNIVFESFELQTNTQYTLDCINIECEELKTKKFSGKANTQLAQNSEAPVCEACYINPSSIFAIHQNGFENTFIATREFSDRLQVLHRIENAQTYFDLYVTQLGRNLHEIDLQVSKLLTGKEKEQFEAFAAEKLTNVKPSGQNYDLLRKYYQNTLQKQQQETSYLQKEYATKSKAELTEIQKHLQKLSSDYSKRRNSINTQGLNTSGIANEDLSSKSVSPRSARNLRTRVNSQPSVGRQSSYKIPWNGVGWVNIDTYLKELGKNDKVVSINAKSSDPDVKVYQSVNTLKTIIPLNRTNSGYEAHFPESQSSLYDNSFAVGISRKKDGTFDFALSEYNPYGISEVAFNNWKNYSESELSQFLIKLNPVGSQIFANIERESQQIQEALDRQKRTEDLQKKKEAELAKLEKQFEANKAIIAKKQRELFEKQAKERAFLQNLENSMNPCHEDFGVSNVVTVPRTEIVEFPDVEAEFMGGQSEMMRWIISNTQYPQGAIEQNIAGKIYVSFIVDSNGQPSDPKIDNEDLELALLELEALRLVHSMPKWKPGEVNGFAVVTRVRIPITFTLE